MTEKNNTDAWIFDRNGRRIEASIPEEVANELYDIWGEEDKDGKHPAFQHKGGKIRARDIWVRQDVPPSASDEWQPN